MCLTHTQICPCARFVLSNWFFVVRRLAAYCGMLRRKRRDMPHSAPRETGSGVNATWAWIGTGPTAISESDTVARDRAALANRTKTNEDKSSLMMDFSCRNTVTIHSASLLSLASFSFVAAVQTALAVLISPTFASLVLTHTTENKKPSYRWRTARRGRASWNLVKFCTNVDDLYLKSSETRLLPIRL